MLIRMFELSRKGIAFNLLTDKVEKWYCSLFSFEITCISGEVDPSKKYPIFLEIICKFILLEDNLAN